MTTITFTPEQAWEYASQWGSMMTNGDPGACMYGFNSDCRPQSDEHRQEVIGWMIRCKRDVVINPDRYDDNEADKIDSFIKFIQSRGLAEKSFYIELSSDCVTACRLDGEEVDGQLRGDLFDCNRSGDMTEPVNFVINKWKPQFCIVKQVDGEYKNVPATYQDKLDMCKQIWLETSFPDGVFESRLDKLLVYEAALNIESE